METSLSDQLANISPVYIVLVVLALTLVRLFLAKVKEGWARTTAETCDTLNFVVVFVFLLVRPFVAQAFYIPSESMENTLLVQDRLCVDKVSYRFHEPHHGDVIVFEAPPAATHGEAGVDFIKRMIGAPGDTIQVKAAELTVDGQRIIPDRGDLHSYLRDHLNLKEEDALKIFPDHLLVNSTQTIGLPQLAQALGQPGAKIELTPGETLRNDEVLNEPYTREDPDYDMPATKLAADQLFMMGDNRNHSADSHVWGPLERRRVIGHAAFVFLPFSRIGMIR